MAGEGWGRVSPPEHIPSPCLEDLDSVARLVFPGRLASGLSPDLDLTSISQGLPVALCPCVLTHVCVCT